MRYAVGDRAPRVADGVFIAPNATLIGDVIIEDGASVWFGVVMRGDVDSISVGRGSNVQDLTVVHCDPGMPVRVGENVTIGHSCIIHGCTIEENCLIGMGSTVLNGARIGANSLVGAGSLVTEGKEFPPGSVIMGRPAKVVRQVSEIELARIRRGSEFYQLNAERFRRELSPAVDAGLDAAADAQ